MSVARRPCRLLVGDDNLPDFAKEAERVRRPHAGEVL